ncbi:MAG TPA: TolC family outer membrane protein [Steroidobacteraceae bacterium]|jgi:outer membrane protein
MILILEARQTVLRYSLALITMVLAAKLANANDLNELYRLAQTRDASLQASGFQRDAAIEARPQALAQWLPQVSAAASATRERAGFDSGQSTGTQAADCALSAAAGMQHCYGTVHSLGLNLSQTLWSFQAFSQLKEANFQAAAAEAGFRSAQQNLLLRVAQAYFAILSAADQLAANRAERDAFGTLLSQARTREQTGVGPRSDVEQAQAFYDATEQSVIDAQNALDDANLALTEIVGAHAAAIAPLRQDIPLVSPEPASAEEWVTSARQDNFDVRTAELKMEAAARDVSAQRGRGLPTFSLTGSSSKLTQDEVLGGNQTLDTVGVSFTWPLFQGGAVASAVRQSRALYRQAEAIYDSARRDTERLTRAAFRNIVSGIQRIGAARRAVDSGRAAVEASRRNVEFGTGTEFELLDAQNNYYAAVRAYSQSRYDYLTSVLTLKQQAGRLSEHDLAAIDDLLVETGS